MFNLKKEIVLEKFQEEGVRYLLKHHYAILGDKMGLGKTIQAIAVASFLRLRTVVVCPSYLRSNWAAEIEKFSMRRNVRVIKSGEDLRWYVPSDEHFIIVSYSLIKSAKKLFNWCEYVVADEAQNLKNPKAKRTNYFLEMLEECRPERCTQLSGTIIKNGVDELYTQLVFMGKSPKKTNGRSISEVCSNYYSFKESFSNSYVKEVRGRTIKQYHGVKNLKVLKNIMKGKYIRRDESVLDLPEYMEKEIYVDYKGKDKKLWDAFQNKDKSSDSTTKAKAALQTAKFTAEYAKGLHEAEGAPIVVYTDHVQACVEIAERLGVPYIHGGIPNRKRDEIIAAFKAGEQVFFVATIGAASTGITLVQGNHLVFNDLSWVPGNNIQAWKRIHRIGQTKTCFIHYIFGTKTSGRIKNAVGVKSKVLKEVL